MKTKTILQVLPEDILAEDIYAGETLIIKKGTKITERLINRLKKRGIKELKVSLSDTHTMTKRKPTNDSLPFARKLTETSMEQKSEEELEKLFFHILGKIGYEYRYGKLLNKQETLLFLKQLFISIHKNYPITDTLAALYKWDSYAYIHSFDVFILGSLMAKKLAVTDIESCAAGYLFHDIGKIKTPRDILHKPAKLTGAEFKQIQQHTTDGERILHSLGYQQLDAFARSHHERLDGTGYPDGLYGEQLPLELRILSIVDVFSALTLKRAYKEELPAHEAIKLLLKDQQQFDWHVLYHFIDSLMIYPHDATVLLSNNEQAKISSVSKYYPTVPQVRLLKGGEQFSLPTNLSLTVQKILSFQPKTEEQLFSDFLNCLAAGDHEAVTSLYQTLADGLPYHRIFEKILHPAVVKVTQMAALNQISAIAFQQSEKIINALLDQIAEETEPYTNFNSTAIILYPEYGNARLHARLLAGYLHMEAVQVKMTTKPAGRFDPNKLFNDQHTDYLIILDFPDHCSAEFTQDQTARLTFSSFDESNTMLLWESLQKNNKVFIHIPMDVPFIQPN
ncbi:HD-GYP domain-containing protein [Sediminibacillus halophilus]|uniref:HDIG domain-containing protein n=1 Tax=Sediminibacillus halophilus TaxID=482461 RepID=A0A1G9QZF1_9BACI|nr:HD domain-containing phosphohydrolase [Sediminibacillus halophilus]SDM16406.1 HDIG domain-containing protein [Sediminibacillus halophilus]